MDSFESEGFNENAAAVKDVQWTEAADPIWKKLLIEKDSSARDALIHRYIPYARMVAATYYGKRFNDDTPFDDYLQWATLGMIESLDRFDPAHGVQFKHFATRRMQGAILDGIACSTEKQQQIALRTRLRKERLDSIKQRCEVDIGDSESRGATPLEPENTLSYLAEVGIGLALAWMLEDTGMLAAGTEVPGAVEIPYLQVLEFKLLKKQLHQLIETLPRQQQTVIRGHYLYEMPFEQIAKNMVLSRGRIAQIHKQALMQLRHALKENAKCNVAL
jgi:RNA polymerase sigma factor for flagellar operon FliA